MSGSTEIPSIGWVAHLPAVWRPYALLMRLHRPIGSWLLFLPGLWAFAMAAPSWGRGLWLTVLFAIGAVLMRGAGCVVNDLWDSDIDRQVARTAGRPLASGAARPGQAIAFLAGVLAVSLLILVLLPPVAILLGVLSLVPVVLYPLAKRVTNFPQAMLGLVFSWAAPMGYAAATGHIDGAALALWAAGFFWILGYDTIYAHQDRADDALVGIGSTALHFGDRTRPFLAACYALSVCLLALAGWLGGLSPWFLLALPLPALLLARQVLLLDIDDPALCDRLFHANREVGLAIAAAFLIGRL
jgi:4-hydroxybenzoate polyprenyltransferase